MSTPHTYELINKKRLLDQRHQDLSVIKRDVFLAGSGAKEALAIYQRRIELLQTIVRHHSGTKSYQNQIEDMQQSDFMGSLRIDEELLSLAGGQP